MKRRLGLLLVAAAIGAILAPSAFGQGVLTRTTGASNLDGRIGANEYSWKASDQRGDYILHLNWSSERLSIGAQARTTGWIAFGVGSAYMQGAKIMIGFVDGDGKVSFRTDLGQGHSHRPADTFTTVGHGLSEANGWTTMEVQLDPAQFISPGQSTLDMILAYGPTDSFTQYHSTRIAAEISLQQ